MDSEPLVDSYDRIIGSVRISLTDRCNLRCQYCMPEDGVKWVNPDEILTFEEQIRIAKIFYQHGVRKFRLTGGEPTIRNNFVTFVRMMKETLPDIDLSMTTNGLKLEEMAKDLRNAGLDRINISLDTLDHDKFADITRRDKFDKVMKGIDKSVALDYDEIKVNAVSIKSFNDDIDSLIKFIDFSEEKGIEVRFIEIMPFTGNNWEEGGYISSKELRERISQHEDMVKLPLKSPSSTSKTWSLRDGKAKIGFISSVSESFCDSCNRVRITAEGKLRPCLHNAKEYDLKELLRNGSSNEVILQRIRKGINEKWKGHPDFTKMNYQTPVDDREMIKIGG